MVVIKEGLCLKNQPLHKELIRPLKDDVLVQNELLEVLR